jgi:hypothetical protein
VHNQEDVLLIDPKEFEKVIYLDPKVIGDRQVNLMPLWDGLKWHQWISVEGKLMEFFPVDVEQADYVAKGAARETDLWVPFVDLMWQRASWADISPRIITICDDFHNLFTSTAKLRHFHRMREVIGNMVSVTFAATEIEYIAIVARGIFDLVQEVISLLWSNRILLLDETAEKKRKASSLPSTFTKMVLKDKKSARTAAEISSEFYLPSKLAEEYEKHSPFFSQLRDVRDRMVHGLGSTMLLFSTEKGFCVNPKLRPFNTFNVWHEEHFYNSDIASLLPWLSHIVLHTVDACSALMAAFASEIQFPPEIAPGYRVFVRGTNSNAIIELLKSHRGESAWWEDESVKTT